MYAIPVDALLHLATNLFKPEGGVGGRGIQPILLGVGLFNALSLYAPGTGGGGSPIGHHRLASVGVRRSRLRRVQCVPPYSG
jgi:hypothetical protein